MVDMAAYFAPLKALERMVFFSLDSRNVRNSKDVRTSEKECVDVDTTALSSSQRPHYNPGAITALRHIFLSWSAPS